MNDVSINWPEKMMIFSTTIIILIFDVSNPYLVERNRKFLHHFI